MSNVNANMNELLSKIDTINRSFFNKLMRKPSKSTEFLDILEKKINIINFSLIKYLIKSNLCTLLIFRFFR